MFYAHIDILKNIKCVIFKYLIKACYCNFSMYNTLHRTCLYMYNTLHHNCMCNRLPEDESSVSKRVEDISVVYVQFVGLYCIIMLYFSVLRASQ